MTPIFDAALILMILSAGAKPAADRTQSAISGAAEQED
jgi:hypothetical protein